MTACPGHASRPLFSRPWVVAVALLGAALIAYANSFSVPYLLDDTTTLRDNPAWRNAASLREALNPPTHTGVGGRPAANLAFVLNHAVTGDSLAGLHAVNLLLHLLAAATLFAVIRRTLQRPVFRGRWAQEAAPIGLVAATLWLLHPVQTQSVTYLSQRTEVLMGLCYLLCLYAFIRATESGRPLAWQLIAVLSGVAGMASKESMVTAPLMILLYDYLFVAERDLAAIRARRGGFHAALAASWVLLAVLMRELPARGVGFGAAMDSATYALIESQAILRYVMVGLWPQHLVFDYGTDFTATTAHGFLAAGLVLLVAGFAVWRLWRGQRRAFPVIWFLLVLAPTSSVVPIPLSPVAENRVYLPLAALVAGLAVASHAVAGRRGLIACVAIAPAFTALTSHRNHDYRSAVSIWTDTVEKMPGSSRAHNNLGEAHQTEGRLPEALAAFTRAVTLRPDYAVAHENLGAAAGLLGRDDLALQHARRAVQLDPASARGHYILGVALRNSGAMADALTAFETAARLQPTYAEAWANLAGVQLQLGRADVALAASLQALAANPRLASARHAHAAALHELGRVPAALAAVQAHVQEEPDDRTARHLLGLFLLQAREFAAAAAQYEHLIRLHPQDAAAHSQLATALLALGRLEAARDEFATALRLDPSSSVARAGLAQIEGQSGK